jgi:hypothetical protein
MKHTHPKIEAVEHDVADDHYGNQPEPDETHHDQAPIFSLQWRMKTSIGMNRIGSDGLWPVADLSIDQHGEQETQKRAARSHCSPPVLSATDLSTTIRSARPMVS